MARVVAVFDHPLKLTSGRIIPRKPVDGSETTADGGLA
jgi:hypothetical protein